MKTWFITLPFLCAVGVSFADDVGKEGAAEQAVATNSTQSRESMHARAPKRLPAGDMRHCLDLKSNAAIIRCAETRRKR